MRKFLIIPTIVMLTAVIILALMIQQSAKKSTPKSNPLIANAKLRVANHTFNVNRVTTPQQQSRGLGGITKLEPDQGMYFPLTHHTDASFWMKDMNIAIDIIWITDDKIAGITENIPYPSSNTPDDQLQTYASPVAYTQAVFEIAAGRSRQLGLKTGDPVALIE